MVRNLIAGSAETGHRGLASSVTVKLFFTYLDVNVGNNASDNRPIKKGFESYLGYFWEGNTCTETVCA